MKLSEAIRVGSKMHPQAFGNLRDSDGTCAVGAALEATNTFGVPIYETFPILTTLGLSCPFCPSPKSIMGNDCVKFGQIIAHINDVHRLSREAIAEWVETIEKKLETEQAPSPKDGESMGESGACTVGKLDYTPAEVTQ